MSQMACHTMFLALTLSPEMTMQAMYLLTWTGLGLIQPMPSCSCLGGFMMKTWSMKGHMPTFMKSRLDMSNPS